MDEEVAPSAEPAPEPSPEPAPARQRGPLRRLWWLWLTLAVIVVLVLGSVVTAALVGVRAIRADERSDRAQSSAVRACGDLETRLNRLAPPGSAKSPRQRAAAVRAENSALTPFVSELDGLRTDWHGRRRSDYVAAWHALLDARAAYADALDREATGGETAFFLLPRTRSGESVADVLLDVDLSDCGGVVRRLTRPDL